jgi:hypothetical protein
MKADQFGHVNGHSVLYAANPRPRYAPDVLTPNRQRFLDALAGTKHCKMDKNKMHLPDEKDKVAEKQTLKPKAANQPAQASSFSIPFLSRQS